jgi:UPF0755 protein
VRKRALTIGAGLVLLAFLVATAAINVAINHRPDAGEAIRFSVQPGEAFSAVTDSLHRDGLIEYPRLVGLYALLKRYDRRIKAGTYLLTPGERPKDILAKLVRGDIYRVSVTIPEGFMLRQIAGVLAAQAELDSSAFVVSLDDEQFREELGVPGPSFEGYLFPDTYDIPWGTGPRNIAALMVGRLDEVFDGAMQRRAEEIGLTRHEVLTLASIVEAETQRSDERPLVSAVYHNRLRKGMRLEADPTVAYAMGGYKGRLFYRDLEIDSPYNTYKNDGLPPGPICSPGRASIVATLYPDSTSQAIYFVAEGDGGHIFSRTLSEHLAAVRKVRESRSN